MKIQQIRDIARDRGLNPGRLGKVELIRAIQRAEGNFDRFATARRGAMPARERAEFDTVTSFLTMSILSILLFRHWPVSTFSSISPIFNQLPCFGVYTK